MADRRALLRGLAALSVGAVPFGKPASAATGKPGARLATMEDMAAAEFEPLQTGKDFAILSREQWQKYYDTYIVASNAAARLLADTKPQLVERIQPWMEDEDFAAMKMLRSMFEDTEGFLCALQQPITIALTRLLCCGCAIVEEDGSADDRANAHA